MKYDEKKVDEMTLALLWLVMHDGGYGTTRAWVTSERSIGVQTCTIDKAGLYQGFP